MNELQKVSHREHILLRPDMYIGSVVEDVKAMWCYAEDAQRMVKREVRVVPACLKIFDEILVNALDRTALASVLTDRVKNIRISIGECGRITVTNDGDGIPCGLSDAGCHYAELAFGHLLTSTNYKDNEGRITGGMNGIGSKACNIFSSSFSVETVDAVAKRVYTQEWSDNMATCSPPRIRACQKKPYTTVSFTPDYARFGMEGLTPDMRALFLKRAYDSCAVTDDGVSIHVNGVKTGCKSLKKYADMFLGSDKEKPRVHEKINAEGRYPWEVVAASWERAEQVSYVNGIATVRGGCHVDHIAAQVAKKFAELANRRNKELNLKAQHVRDHLFLMVRSTIPDPVFDAQTKETLTTTRAKFGGGKVEVSDTFIEKLFKSTDLLSRASALAAATQGKAVKKTDGAKRNVVRVPKLDDANWAGGAKSAQCTLILTEGDSAKTMVIAGLSVVGRDKFGVFPLRGKLLNVREAAAKKIQENVEITAIKKILGLESGRTYSDTKELRYGRILVLADQDVDGSHIKGLLVNVFASLWPSLFAMDGFIATMGTPIVKVKAKGGRETSFYNLHEYDEWRAAHGNEAGWSVKYYKGLGTSTTAEAKEYFRSLHVTRFLHDGDSDAAMNLAFNKSYADQRKAWLGTYDRTLVLQGGGFDATLTHRDFVDKELIHFSNYDLERSLPSAIDGFKTSQRKIMYSCFKRDLTQEIKVAQLAGYVSEHSAYKHGETSLQGAIVCLAQNYVGSNNINLLQPAGQFGTRIQGGKDAASARYIHTLLEPWTRKIFRAEDNPVLQYLQDDGKPIEPLYYVPIIPMVLVNGAEGIGTGFSTQLPCFDALEVLENTRLLAVGDTMLPMEPKYRGFEGLIKAVDTTGEGGEIVKWSSSGIASRHAGTTVHVTELPIGTWTEDYKEFLEREVAKNGVLRAVDSHYTESKVKFVLRYATAADADAALASDALKLTTSPSSLRTSNVHLFSAKAAVQRFEGVEPIMRAHHAVRLDMYDRRKAHQVLQLEALLEKLQAKARFVGDVVEGRLQLLGRSRLVLEKDLTTEGFPALEGGHDYLIQMPISSLTFERRQQLQDDADKRARELDALRAAIPLDMWLCELDELRSALEQRPRVN